MASFSDQLIFIDRHRIQFDDGVQSQLRFIGKGRQHVKQIEHRAAGGVFDIRHKAEQKAGRILSRCPFKSRASPLIRLPPKEQASGAPGPRRRQAIKSLR